MLNTSGDTNNHHQEDSNIVAEDVDVIHIEVESMDGEHVNNQQYNHNTSSIIVGTNVNLVDEDEDQDVILHQQSKPSTTTTSFSNIHHDNNLLSSVPTTNNSAASITVATENPTSTTIPNHIINPSPRITFNDTVVSIPSSSFAYKEETYQFPPRQDNLSTTPPRKQSSANPPSASLTPSKQLNRVSLDNSQLHRISRIITDEEKIASPNLNLVSSVEKTSTKQPSTIINTNSTNNNTTNNHIPIYPPVFRVDTNTDETSTFTTTTTTTTSRSGQSNFKFDDDQLLEAWRKSYNRRNSRVGSIYNSKTQDDMALIYGNDPSLLSERWKRIPSRYFSKDEDVEVTSQIGRLKQSKIIVSSDNKNIHVTEIEGVSNLDSNGKESKTPLHMTSKELGFSSSDEEDRELKAAKKKTFRKGNSKKTLELHESPLVEKRSPLKINTTDSVFETGIVPQPVVYSSPMSLPGSSIDLPSVMEPPKRKPRYVNHIREESLYVEDAQEAEDDFVVKKTDMAMIENSKERPRQVDSYNVNDYLSMKPVKDIVNKNIVKQLRKAEEEGFSDDEDESVVTAPPTITETTTKTEDSKKQFERIYVNNREENKNNRKSWPTNYVRTTKYTLLTFIPKNLFEQFKKVTNIYFLISVIAVLLPDISPVSPATSIIPLIVIVMIQMFKDAIEDLQRYRQDRKANNEKCRVIRGGQVVEIRVKDVEIGEIVLVSKEETFPSDLLCIHSSREDDMCYVETANLDGETNLKTRRSLKAGKFLHDIPEHTIHKSLSDLDGQLKVELPNSNLDTFEGNIKLKAKVGDQKLTQKEAMTMDNLLLRGCVLKNTKHIYGIAIYVGNHTKILKNLKENKQKRNDLDITLNKILVFLLILQQIICAIVAAFYGLFQDNYQIKAFYLRPVSSAPASFTSVMSTWVTCFILLNLMIPMSLVVGLEIIKTFQSKMIESDKEMWHGDFKAEVKSSNMNQALSNLDVIFSDKTGTLTQNEMKYSDSWVGGLYYSEIRNPGLMKNYMTEHKPSLEEPPVSDTAGYHAYLLREFLLCLALNNNVIPERDPKNPERIVYDGPSSDEIALLEAARNNGFVLLQRTNAGVLIDEMGEKKFYDIVATIEFTSDRKRMCVIVKSPEGRYICYVKGADSVMIKRCRARKHYVTDLKLALETFSIKGLRTLVCARKEISEEEFQVWIEAYTKATLSTKNREKLLIHSAADMEIDLQLIGCTAIEDKLQENAVETITYLSKAGFQIWVLTGDKTETAINVAYSTNILHKDETIEIRIRDSCNTKHVKKKMKVALEFLERHKNKHFEYGLVIDSKSLDFALEKYEKQFLKIVQHISCAVCSRLKPLQKARIVKLIESKLKKKALAVGDGVNDVAMIQAATVGVGIKGKEGSQASRSADYALPRFKNLVRLIALHGRYCCVRNADFLLFNFYKNVMIVVPQILYCIYTGFTCTIFFESWLLTMFNTIYCFFQPIVSGVFEKDLPEEVILQHPEIYSTLKKSGTHGNLFNIRSLLFWTLDATYHSLIVFFGVLICYGYEDILENGPSDVFHFGTVVLTTTVTIITFKFALSVKSWSLPIILSIWGSYLSYFVFVVIYTPIPVFFGKGTFHFVYYHTFMSVKAILVTMLLSVVALLPDLLIKFIRFGFFPHDYQKLLIEYKHEQKLKKKQKPAIEPCENK
ncbi:MgtA domain/ATPase domain-containing protein [Naegleria gruberi]|uniref:Phospholipid-transporting ATPase n=1 Tax=Naegleria gruberi TaxID=5762 RepID=D2VLX9_NAEGR|nr:MgtA domain/ATPase domain-containing protein [Naegleria gruberi]EFC42222.1 MgtA domain/ATPase domain-containing protein [Naegleria gruberi]|eukprot:XP_002674966.1 MgtA domain/ATPase domain-containing protein [Naegleria gruberi strain NEG-M]